MKASPTGSLQALRDLREHLVQDGAYLARRFFTERNTDMETQFVAGTRRKQIRNQIGKVLDPGTFEPCASTNRLGR